MPMTEPPTPSPSRPAPAERGSVATELVLLVPVLVVLLVLVGFAGRVARAESTVRTAASQAARAASLRQTPGAAAADARAVASVGTRSLGCVEQVVEVDTGSLRPGGHVSVTVRCRADFGDLGLLGVPGSRWFSARSVQVVDARRGG